MWKRTQGRDAQSPFSVLALALLTGHVWASHLSWPFCKRKRASGSLGDRELSSSRASAADSESWGTYRGSGRRAAEGTRPQEEEAPELDPGQDRAGMI